ncbi:MAG: cell division protein ZapA [Oscillospiraceae bacterium]|nr:cell division protein ZapA [Oscillospiraceae bacterium]
MQNHVTVSICGEEYTLVAEEAPSYMQKVGSYVDEKLTELLNSSKVGRTDAAVLTAINVADDLFKLRQTTDDLRNQLKQSIDENNQLRNEISALRRQVYQLSKSSSKPEKPEKADKREKPEKSEKAEKPSEPEKPAVRSEEAEQVDMLDTSVTSEG